MKATDLSYVFKALEGKKEVIVDLMNSFLKHSPEGLAAINDAVTKANYADIHGLTHKLKSSVSIMGASGIASILEEMKTLTSPAASPGNNRDEKIIELNRQLNSQLKQAIEEIEEEKAKLSKS